MRYLLLSLIEWFQGWKKKAEWSRETPWRQGHVLPAAKALGLRLIKKKELSSRLAVVMSHDCDLANTIEDEPNVEIIIGTLIPGSSADKTHAKNVRILHIEMDGPGGRKHLELVANAKVTIPKRRLSDFSPDSAYSFGKPEIETFRSWLAARYRRASIPDGLQALVRSIFEDVAKKKDRPKALRGIWIDFEPDLDNLNEGEKYELWVTFVYDTSVEGAKSTIEEMAKQAKEKFEKKYKPNGKWTKLDLRECVARADTEFTYYDTYRYRLFRLEYLSLRFQADAEIGNE
jgi:hypothetical protein